jgi:hypothetical protein
MSRAVASGVNEESRAFSSAPPGATCDCQQPNRTLRAGVFFDGTSKNKDVDLPQKTESNVVRMWKVYREGGAGLEVRKKIYITGVGSMPMGERTRQAGREIAQNTRWYNPLSPVTATGASGGRLAADLGHNVAGLIGGAGGKERLNRAYFWLKDRCAELPKQASKTVDIYGWSRGASLSRTFVNLVNMALRKLEPAIAVRFVGIWDTVGSFGMPGDDSNPGQNLYIDATDAQAIVHQTARHELRHNFPLTIGPGIDREYAGEHTDVGGGHPPKDPQGKLNHLTFICFKDMHTASARAGVALDPWRPIVPAVVDVERLRKQADIYAGAGAVMTAPNSPWMREKQQFFNTYVHVSASDASAWWWLLPPIGAATHYLNPNRTDSSGQRRKFTAKRMKLKGTPPNFDWS